MVKRLIKKILSIIHKKSYEEIQLDKYRQKGMSIGEGCKIYSELPNGRDAGLLSIGNNCTISTGVNLVLHDNGVIKGTHGEYTDILGRIIISDNCFIGIGSLILPGVFLADMTIVGGGSVVVNSVEEPGLVIAGNPAKIICSVEEYINRNQNYMVNLDGWSPSDIIEYANNNPEKLIRRPAISRNKK